MGIDTRRLVDRVVQRIGEDVVAASIEAGESLPTEPALGRQLGVSRSVLREALRVLASKGLIETRPRLGTRVRPREDWNLLDPDVLSWLSAAEPPERFARELFGLRRVVEPTVAALAAGCIRPAELHALEDSLAAMIAAGEDAALFYESDLRFHQALLRAVGNRLVQALGGVVGEALELNLRLSLRAPMGQQKSIPLHRAVLQAVRAGNSDGARAAMARLIDEAEQDALGSLAGRRQRPNRPAAR
jgi:DNA-binding FadR family transcriptional regulator